MATLVAAGWTMGAAIAALNEYGGTVIETSLCDEDTENCRTHFSHRHPLAPPPDLTARNTDR